MSKEKESRLKEKITEYLKKNDAISFVILFGSFANGSPGPMSDIDIGIYFIEIPDLIKIGTITNKLEKITGIKIDITILNNLYQKNPEFSYNIVKEGNPLFFKNRQAYVAFKRDSILAYLDISPMRAKVKDTLSKRIKNGKIGERNFAGKI